MECCRLLAGRWESDLRVSIFLEQIFNDHFSREKGGGKHSYLPRTEIEKEQQDRGSVEVGQMHCRLKKNNYYD